MEPSNSPSRKRFVFFQFGAEVMRAHAVRLVHDHQVPFGFLELLLQLLVAGQLVHAGDQQRAGLEDVEVHVGVDELISQQVEAQSEFEEEFVLPLLDQSPRGGDDEALLDVVAENQLLDIETGHDGLARTWVVGQQEPQWRPGE